MSSGPSEDKINLWISNGTLRRLLTKPPYSLHQVLNAESMDCPLGVIPKFIKKNKNKNEND